MERNLNEVTLALDSLRLEKDSLVLDLFEQTKYKDEVEILRKEKERLSEKADALWKEVKDHQDLGTAKVLYISQFPSTINTQMKLLLLLSLGRFICQGTL